MRTFVQMIAGGLGVTQTSSARLRESRLLAETMRETADRFLGKLRDQ